MRKRDSEIKKATISKSSNKTFAPGKKYRVFQYHYLFLLIGLFFGLKLIFVNPPWQTNDEDRHFFNAYALSEGYIAPKVENGKLGYPMPTKLIQTVSSFQGIRFSSTNLIPKDELDKIKKESLEDERKSFYANATSGFLPFPYIPAAIMIKVGKVINSNPLWLGWWGRIGSLLAYLIIIFYALKNIPHFKPLLMVIALSPMALYQGASVTYDSLNFALLFLLFALLIKFYYQKIPITLNKVLLFFLIALAHRCSKDGYFILYFSLFAISITKFESKKVYFLSIILLLIASFVPSFFWNSYLASLQYPEGAFSSFQKDFKFDGGQNLAYQLHDPLHMVSVLIQNTFSQGREWIGGSIGRFGYSYTLLPWFVIFLQVMVYIAVVVLEKPGKLISSRFRLGLAGCSLLATAALIFGALLYLSPIGANMIFGLQGRYFTPILPFLFSAIFYLPISKLNENIFKWSVVVYCIAILWFTSNFLDSAFYS